MGIDAKKGFGRHVSVSIHGSDRCQYKLIESHPQGATIHGG